ncbi:hypothetical protein SFRURICE_011781 [Spodoptera frugiperda]|nr:hypothetical protein SFRURICE_011781 [Spodoptera frugiperda]
MKVVFLVCVLAAVVYGEQYTNKYDNIDLDEILHNDKILDNYVKCCLDQGKCTPDGKELKSHIKEALENRCAKCTDAQKEGTKKVLTFLINNKPAIWDQLCNKYDPEGLYRKKYEQEYQSVKQ